MRIINRNGMQQKTLSNTSGFSFMPMLLQCSHMPVYLHSPSPPEPMCRIRRVHSKTQYNRPAPVSMVAADTLPTVIVGLFFNF